MQTIGFLSERAIEVDYLNQTAKWFGKRIIPSYQIADFNRNGIQDFAMILSREGEPEENGSDVEEFRYNHLLVIVIFNRGRRVSYAPVFVKEIKALWWRFSPMPVFPHAPQTNKEITLKWR